MVGTRWDGKDIWLRSTFQLTSVPDVTLSLRIHDDEDAEIYLNGRPVAEVRGHVTGYAPLACKTGAHDALKVGDNVLAVHCRQTGGGQFIDVGLQTLNIVMKLTSANGQSVAKLSDSPGKTLCDDATFLAYLRQVFNVPAEAS